MTKYHKGAASWVVFEQETCQVLDRRAGAVLIKLRGFPTWVLSDSVYPA